LFQRLAEQQQRLEQQHGTAIDSSSNCFVERLVEGYEQQLRSRLSTLTAMQSQLGVPL
jgi:hypothetical protein